MAKLGKLNKYGQEGQKIILEFEQGRAQIEVLTPYIVNVFYDPEKERVPSKAIEGSKSVSVNLALEEKKDGLWIHTGQVSVRVCDDFYVDFFDKDGREVCLDYRGERRPLERVSSSLLEQEGHSAAASVQQCKIQAVKQLKPSLHFYGLGDKTGFLDKRHYDYEMWNTDNPAPQVDCFKALYKSIPFFMALDDTHVYGLFFDNTFKGYFNMGQESEEYY